MRKIWAMVLVVSIVGVIFWSLIHFGLLQALIPYAFGEIHRAGQP